MMATFHGKTGQGKTGTIAALGYVDYLRGLDVQSNFKLTYPKERGAGRVTKLDLATLANPEIELENLSLLLQEIYNLVDSRRSGSDRNLDATTLFNQSRKRDMNVYGDAQLFGSIDNRLRGTVDSIGLCKKFNSEGQHVRDPLWTDPKGTIRAQMYDPETIKPIPGAIVPFSIGAISPLYDTRERSKVVEIEG